jgi:putative intracellular protease/amidase
VTFANSAIEMIESFVAAGKPIGIVCHSTGALRAGIEIEHAFFVGLGARFGVW